MLSIKYEGSINVVETAFFMILVHWNFSTKYGGSIKYYEVIRDFESRLVFNLNKSEVAIIQIDLDCEFSLNHPDLDSFGLNRIKFRFWWNISDSLELSRIDF